MHQNQQESAQNLCVLRRMVLLEALIAPELMPADDVTLGHSPSWVLGTRGAPADTDQEQFLCLMEAGAQPDSCTRLWGSAPGSQQ